MDIFPVVTLFLGYGASYLTELLRDRRTVRREREARAASQQDRNFERHVTFQEKTLLEMQEAALDLVQIRTEYLIQWSNKPSAGNDWRGASPRDDLFNRLLLSQARSEMVAARVDDSAVRQRIVGIQKHADGLRGSKDPAEGEKELAYMFGYNDMLNKRIGEVLRQLNAVEVESSIVKLPPPDESNSQELPESKPEPTTQG